MHVYLIMYGSFATAAAQRSHISLVGIEKNLRLAGFATFFSDHAHGINM